MTSVQTSLLLADRYQLGALIGRGGMADVFRSRDLRTGHEVAVKLFRPGLDLAETRRRRRRELAMLSSLQHDGLVSVLDVEAGDGPNSDALYLVVELVDGPTLRERFAERPFSDREVGLLGAAMCDAVAYMHGRGVVHRDIKPANVLLDRTDGRLQPKLTDFGIARMIDSTRMTAEGLTAGTANYLSPEQALGADVDMPSDVYSLGLVLIEALTGAVAFPGHGVEAAVARLHRQPQVPSRINPRLADLLTRMTARDPLARPTADEAGAELALIADPSLLSEVLALGHDAGEPRTQEMTLGTKRRHRLVVAFAASFVVAAAGLSVWAVASHRADTRRTSEPTNTRSSATSAPVPDPPSPRTTAGLGAAGRAGTKVNGGAASHASSSAVTVRNSQNDLAAASAHTTRRHAVVERPRQRPAHPGSTHPAANRVRPRGKGKPPGVKPPGGKPVKNGPGKNKAGGKAPKHPADRRTRRR